jgi:hypothetical protein
MSFLVIIQKIKNFYLNEKQNEKLKNQFRFYT